jgi:hypothetical protein
MFAKRSIIAALALVAGLGAAVPAAAAGRSADSASLIIEIDHRGQNHRWDRGSDDRGGWNNHRPDRRHFLSPREVRSVLRDRGFRGISYVDRRGAIYQARAFDRRGRAVGIVVSARDGDILNVYRIR